MLRSRADRASILEAALGIERLDLADKLLVGVVSEKAPRRGVVPSIAETTP